MLDPAKVGFRPLRLSDMPLLHRWLNTEHVARWWADEPRTYDAVVEKYTVLVNGDEPTMAFVITYGDIAIGYIHTYRIADHPDYARAVAVDEDAAGVDLFIGESDYVHRGLGAPILRRFLQDIVFRAGDVESCIIGPEPANTAAIRAYEKAGFRYLKTIQVPDEPAPEYLMRITREDVSTQT